MKIVLHLNHGTNRSCLVDFGRGLDKTDMDRLLEEGHADAAKALLGYAALTTAARFELPAADIQKAERLADYTISHRGYSLERLA